ncbi:MAG: c-type cytochrome [SAR202 cluster bacterium]|nr:c-type cytochrome [SAR202 cluster bacterium]MDP7103035.1 c-type cytochrome [SAR202 cluster bacterium]MDP7533906.1 c-type cytochrome [SAR202 cluster bacterium]
MRKTVKWIGIVLGVPLALLVLAVVVLLLLGGRRVNKEYDIDVAAVAVANDAGTIARGKHYVETLGLCQECHGENLEGDLLEDDPVFGALAPSNLTPGSSGISGTLAAIDYVRAIRHGVGRSGKPLVLMPSEFFNRINDADLGAIIAYLKSLPPVNNEVPKTKPGPLGRMTTMLDETLVPAGMIDHEAVRPQDIAPTVSVGYGGYLAIVCIVCHGDNYAGGSVPGEGSDAPLAPNLTPKGALSNWSSEEFVGVICTGKTPAGKVLDSEMMPWQRFRALTDDELGAIWLYLSSLAPLDTNE